MAELKMLKSASPPPTQPMAELAEFAELKIKTLFIYKNGIFGIIAIMPIISYIYLDM